VEMRSEARQHATRTPLLSGAGAAPTPFKKVRSSHFQRKGKFMHLRQSGLTTAGALIIEDRAPASCHLAKMQVHLEGSGVRCSKAHVKAVL